MVINYIIIRTVFPLSTVDIVLPFAKHKSNTANLLGSGKYLHAQALCSAMPGQQTVPSVESTSETFMQLSLPTLLGCHKLSGTKLSSKKKTLIPSVSQMWPTGNHLLQNVAMFLSPANTRAVFISLLNILQINWPRKHACIPIIYLSSKHKYVCNRMFCGSQCSEFKK